jgi:drug/metabolite transporter (DMT)-like permease
MPPDGWSSEFKSSLASVSFQSWLQRMSKTRGVFYYVCLNACMVVDSTVVHHLGSKISVEQITFVRGIGIAAFVAMFARGKGFAVFRTRLLPMHIGRGLLTLVSFWFIFYALGHLLLADAAAINYSRALFMTLCGVFWFGEVVSRWRWSAIIVSYLGALLIIGPGFVHWNPVYLIALGGAALNAAAMTGSKYLTQIDGQDTTMAYSAAVSLLFSLSAVTEAWPWDHPVFLVLAISGGLGMWFGQLAVLHADMSLLAPYDYLRLPFVIAIGFVAFNEVPGVVTFGGVALILTSGVLLWARETRRAA